jgi:dTDP-glucose pyrophosphorylase
VLLLNYILFVVALYGYEDVKRMAIFALEIQRFVAAFNVCNSPTMNDNSFCVYAIYFYHHKVCQTVFNQQTKTTFVNYVVE